MNKGVNDRETWRGCGLFFAYCGAILLMLFYTTSLGTNTNDIYWHLQMGEDIVKNGIFPWRDDYSFTANGRPIHNFPFIFEIILYYFVDIFGYDEGTHYFLFGNFSLLTIVTYSYLHKIKSKLLLSCGAITAIACIYHLRLLIRPELISYIFIVIALIQYKRCLYKLDIKNIVLNCILIIIWSNYHAPIFGYIIFFGMYVDIGVQYLKNKESLSGWRKWFFSGILLVLCGYINPFFSHSVFYTLFTDRRWIESVNEFQNVFFAYKDSYIAYGVFVVGLLSMMWAVKYKYFGYLFVVVLLLINSIITQRLIAASGMIFVLFLADMVAENNQGKNEIKRSITWIEGLIFFVFLTFYTILINLFMSVGPIESNKPEKLANYFLKKGYEGNIYSDYGVAGFLIYKLYPSARVSVDGRAGILYDYDLYVNLQKALYLKDAFDYAIKKYKIEYIIIPNEYRISHAVYDNTNFILDFVDINYSLYVKEKGNFPISGYIFNKPYCWRDEFLINIQNEFNIANSLEVLSPYYINYLKSIVEYQHALNKSNFIDEMSKKISSNAAIRFMAYEAIKQKKYNLAYAFFASLNDYQVKDYLAASMALLFKKEYRKAENALDVALNMDYKYRDQTDSILMYLLYTELSKQIDIKIDHPNLVPILKDYFKESDIDIKNYSLGYDILCGVNEANKIKLLAAE